MAFFPEARKNLSPIQQPIQIIQQAIQQPIQQSYGQTAAVFSDFSAIGTLYGVDTLRRHLGTFGQQQVAAAAG